MARKRCERFDADGNRIIDEDSFYRDTECTWTELDPDAFLHVTAREPSYSSPHGHSLYWYDFDGVYRLSNHWGAGIRSCNWFLDTFPDDEDERKDSVIFYCEHGEGFLAFARWEDFVDISSE